MRASVTDCWFPLPPNLANARGWTKWEGAQKRRYYLKCDRCVTILGDPWIAGKQREPIPFAIWSAQIVGYGLAERSGMMDADNLVARLKWPIDWLVSRRFILSDSYRHFWPASFPTQSFTRKKTEAGIGITIMEVTEAELAKTRTGALVGITSTLKGAII